MARGAALITGAAKRLGRLIALELAAQGYDIALHYHASTADAHKTADDIRTLGVRCELLQADLGDSKQVATLAEAAFALFPALNVLINNASIFERGPLKEATEDQLSRHMQLHVHAPFVLTQAFANHCADGVVINMVDARVNQKKHSHFAYLLSKKTLLSYTQMAAVELAPHIRVHAVCPGFVLASSQHEEDYAQRLAARLPMGRTAQPEEVVQAVQFLVNNTGLTGQVLYIDGGENLL